MLRQEVADTQRKRLIKHFAINTVTLTWTQLQTAAQSQSKQLHTVTVMTVPCGCVLGVQTLLQKKHVKTEANFLGL